MLSASLSPSLKRLHDQLRTVQRIAHIGFWEICVDVSDRYIKWSEEMCAILGIPHDHLQHDFESFVSFLHPGDRKRVLAAIDRASRGEESLDIECRLRLTQ